MLYVYGIVDSSSFETIRGGGHDGGDVVAVSAGVLAAAVSRLPACTIEATRQSVWCHEQVLERLMRDHAVLPLRFGTICRDADALRDCLLHSADGLVNDLDRVRGMVEIALRVVEDDGGSELPARCSGCDRVSTTSWHSDEGALGSSRASGNGVAVGRGTAYLRTRLQHHQNMKTREDGGKRLEGLLRQHFDSDLKELICAVPPGESPGFLVSCLVERNQVASFAGVLEQFRKDHPQFHVSSTGPWAPYSFMSATAFLGGE